MDFLKSVKKRNTAQYDGSRIRSPPGAGKEFILRGISADQAMQAAARAHSLKMVPQSTDVRSAGHRD